VRAVVHEFDARVSGAILIRPQAKGIRQDKPPTVVVELAEQTQPDPKLANDIEATIRAKLVATTKVESSNTARSHAANTRDQARRLLRGRLTPPHRAALDKGVPDVSFHASRGARGHRRDRCRVGDFFLYGIAAALVFNKLFFPGVDALGGVLLHRRGFWGSLLTLGILLGLVLGTLAFAEFDGLGQAQFLSRGWRGISLSRESGTIIGGGLFPLAATALLAGTHQSWPVAAIMVACSLLGLVSLGLARERGEDAKSANVVLARDAAAQD
jgi:hypothetical protein